MNNVGLKEAVNERGCFKHIGTNLIFIEFCDDSTTLQTETFWRLHFEDWQNYSWMTRRFPSAKKWASGS